RQAHHPNRHLFASRQRVRERLCQGRLAGPDVSSQDDEWRTVADEMYRGQYTSVELFAPLLERARIHQHVGLLEKLSQNVIVTDQGAKAALCLGVRKVKNLIKQAVKRVHGKNLDPGQRAVARLRRTATSRLPTRRSAVVIGVLSHSRTNANDCL